VLKIKQCINLKFIVELGGGGENSARNKEAIDALEDTHFIKMKTARMSKSQ
jgi:hypothetical protein